MHVGRGGGGWLEGSWGVCVCGGVGGWRVHGVGGWLKGSWDGWWGGWLGSGGVVGWVVVDGWLEGSCG